MRVFLKLVSFLGISDRYLASRHGCLVDILSLAHGRSVLDDNVVVFLYPVLCDPDRTCCINMGAKIQKVRSHSISEQGR